jgi:aminoglycoside 6'-N-acetyltransferase
MAGAITSESAYLPSGSRGLDVYIGEYDLLGLGHGSSLVRQHVDHLFSDGVPAVGIDPHPDNSAACERRPGSASIRR